MSDTSLVRLEQVFPIIQKELAAGRSVKIIPQGISMRPMILGGRDQVVLSPLPKELKKYDLPFYQRDNGQFVLHRIVKADGEFTCIGDNQFKYEKGVRQDQMIAITTGFVRKGKYHSVDEKGYRLYCCLWHWSRPVRGAVHQCIGIFKAILRRIGKLFRK